MRAKGREERVERADPGLLEYLRSRRWFGEKGREIRGAEFVDRLPVSWPEAEGEFVVARVRVDPAGESPVYYQMFLRTDGTLDDALDDEGFRRGLVAAFAAGSTCEARGVRWSIQSESDSPFKAPADAPVTLSRAEQSNTSMFVGSHAVLKLFRKIAPGIHPDLEVTRFLTVERRFMHTPVLLGTIHFADDQGAWAAGMLQELVPGATDAWTYALECSREWFAGRGDLDEVPFVSDAERLGAITRALHETLASGDPGSSFERRDASAEDVAGWTDGTVAMARTALQSAERSADADRAEQRIRELVGHLADDSGACIRVHGDFHLGQVLRSVTNAFLIVDFEGEPSRPLDERRRPHSPLKDVAGMLRSFAYAAAVGTRESERGTRHSAEERSALWVESTRAAFLGGYFTDSEATNTSSGILPSRSNAERLIELFELEKAFYELQYEIDHRPDWRWIPESAISRFLDGAGSRRVPSAEGRVPK